MWRAGFWGTIPGISRRRTGWNGARSTGGWLAGEFLRRVEAGEAVQDFFGSWFEIAGRRQTGYFLGQAWVQEAVEREGFRRVALWSPAEVRQRGLRWLQRAAGMENAAASPGGCRRTDSVQPDSEGVTRP